MEVKLLVGIALAFVVTPAISEGYEPRFSKSYERLTVDEFSNLQVTCYANGSTPMAHEWHDQNEQKIPTIPVSFTVVTPTANGSLLTILRIRANQSGPYLCSVSNEHGQATKVFLIKVKSKESEKMPDFNDIKATNVTTTSIEFSIPANKKIDRIEITRADNPEFKNSDSLRWYSGNSFGITGLLPGKLYYFRINWQYNSISKSATQKIATSAAAPEIVLMHLGGGNIKIEWIPTRHDLNQDVIDKYGIAYHPIRNIRPGTWDKTNCTVMVQVPSCYGSEYAITGLLLNQYYEIIVSAHNSAGFGAPHTQIVHVS